MTLALLADVHGNLEALEAVLRDVDARAPRARIVVAGDVVGYGPDPEACLELLRARRAVCVLGNHEEMVLQWRDDSRCVASGILAVAWTRRRLTRGALGALREFPRLLEVEAGVVVCHGTVGDAGVYVSDEARAEHALDELRRLHRRARILVCGHTHRPMVFSSSTGIVRFDATLATLARGAFAPQEHAHDVHDAYKLGGDAVHLVNPGAVGQVRQGAACARYALLDTNDAGAFRDVRDRGDDDGGARVTFHAVSYDHVQATAKARAAGLLPHTVLSPPRTLMERQIARGAAAAARLVVRTGSDAAVAQLARAAWRQR